MEVITKDIYLNHGRPDNSEIFIYPLGDIHAGSISCSEKAIREQVDHIRCAGWNTYWVGMGDYADSITKNDKRFDIGGLAEWVKPDDIIESQRRWLMDIFKPIRQKCIGMLTGNHEETIHSNHQDDLTRHICKDLDVPYLGYSVFINLHFSQRASKNENILGVTNHVGFNISDIVIHAWHGSGAAQTEGARIMRLMRLVNDIQADIYLMGHLHTIATYAPDRLVLRGGKVSSERLAAVITGSWLKAYTQPDEGQNLNASYAEQKGYKPSRIGCPVIKIRPFEHQYTVES